MYISIVTLYLMSRWTSTAKPDFFAGVHTTNLPTESTYAGVLSRESVRIAFTIPALNDIDILQLILRMLILMLPAVKR